MSTDTILVIDDNPDTLKLVMHVLQAKGFSARGVASTKEADLALAADRPRLAVVDVALPHEDGLTWVQRTRGTPGAPEHFIALTAHLDPDAEERAKRVGCSAFLTKPVPMKRLVEAVEGCLVREPVGPKR